MLSVTVATMMEKLIWLRQV